MKPNVLPTIEESLSRFAASFNERLAEVVTPANDVPPGLAEAMRYSLLAGGKRLRPYLVTQWCVLSGGCADRAFPAAAAVECVHTFSLVHDDLPAMDDDDLRRGRPTNHKQFGEAMAILAGDGLLTLAFELIARHVEDPSRVRGMVLELTRGTGWAGMIGGQVADIEGEQASPSLDRTEFIHLKKTAALFETSCRLGAISGSGDPRTVSSAGAYGRELGIAFQIADDLLDLTSTADTLGKEVQKDARAGKQSYPSVVGTEESRAAADRAVAQANSKLDPFGAAADELRALATFVVRRHH